MARGHYASRVKDPAKAFISTWNTANTSTGSSSNVRVKLPLVSIGTYNFIVNWGDGSSNTITTWNQAEVTHTYSTAGTYTITITGFIKGWDFSNYTGAFGGDRLKIISITQWGCLRLVDNNLALIAGAFYGCQNLNLSGVTDIFNFKGSTNSTGMLRFCQLNSTIPNLNKWDVSKIKVFRSMLRDLPTFDQNVGNWNVSSGKDFVGLFNGIQTASPTGAFNNGGSDSIKNWDVSNGTNFQQIFAFQPLFNQPIGRWDMSKATNINYMFGSNRQPGIFNQDVSDWNISNVTDLGSTFTFQPFFNQPIGKWNTSKVTNMSYTFNCGSALIPTGGIFNQDLSNWDTSNVTNMLAMFASQERFNQNISTWNVSKVTNFGYMLQGADFNQPIGDWDVSKATSMNRMMQHELYFNYPINNWKIPLVTDMTNFMTGRGFPFLFSVENYSNFLIALAAQPLKPNVPFVILQYYNASAVAARAILTSAPNNWTITDKGLQP